MDAELPFGCGDESCDGPYDYRDDLCLGYKLPGAGGGGFLYMMAKDEEAAARIRKILVQEAVNDRARFVEMSLSEKGLEVSRS